MAPSLLFWTLNEGATQMHDEARPEEDPVERIRSALEFLLNEAVRLDLTSIACGITRVLELIRAHAQEDPGLSEPH